VLIMDTERARLLMGDCRVSTRDRMPDPHIIVEVEGGRAIWTGSYWISMQTNRVIEWPVIWWKAAK
jgi:hypothetical protein